ncbi:unnamed protein product [Rhizophagus irregularis]|nr:unnamed protein product [Rhizophagus irregularis]
MYLDQRMPGKTTKIIESPDIGPVNNNPGAIYKSRPLSDMIKSAMSTRSQSLTAHIGKRKFDENNFNGFNEGKIIKKTKLIKNENNGKIL